MTNQGGSSTVGSTGTECLHTKGQQNSVHCYSQYNLINTTDQHQNPLISITSVKFVEIIKHISSSHSSMDVNICSNCNRYMTVSGARWASTHFWLTPVVVLCINKTLRNDLSCVRSHLGESWPEEGLLLWH